MTAKEQAPTADDILAKVDNLLSYYGPMHARFREAWDAYDGQMAIPVANGFEKYIPPTAKGLVDTAVDHQISSNPIITAPPAKQTAKSQATADLMEKYAQTFLNYNAARQVIPPPREVTKQMAICGMGVFKGPLYDEGWWVTRDKRQWQQSFPFIFRAVNPLDVLPDPSVFWGGSSGAVIEVGSKTADEIEKEWEVSLPGRTGSELVDWIEYTSPSWRAYMADGRMVWGPKRNQYGLVYYDICFSGMGTQNGKPEALAVGLLWPILSALKLEARTKTAMDAVVQQDAYEQLVSDIDLSGIKWGAGPGSVTHIPKDANIRPLHPARNSAHLYQFAGMVAEDIRNGGVAEVLEGRSSPGTPAGYLESLRISQAKLKFGQSINTLENKVALILSKLCYLTERLIPDPISIWGRQESGTYSETIDPADINGNTTFYVSFENQTPEENDRRSLVGLQLWRAGAISWQRFADRYLRLQDTTAEQKQMLIEKIMHDPQVMQALAQGAITDWGMSDFVKRIQAQPIGPVGGPAGLLGAPADVAQPPTPPAAPGSFGAIDLQNRQLAQQASATPGAPGAPMEIAANAR